MKLVVVPASRGWQWARQGLQMCVVQPLGFVSLFGLMATLVMLMMTLQLPGLIAVVVAMPALWMSYMLAVRRVIGGEKITPSVLIEPWKAPADRMLWLRLGGLYAAGTLLSTVVAGLLGPDMQDLAKVIEQTAETEGPLSDPAVVQALLLRLAFTIPLSLAFWHTPALLFWGRVPPTKALFFSVVASWRNLPAFLVYGAVWVGVLVLAGVLLRVISGLIPEPLITNFVLIFMGMWIASAFYASLYFSVVDCFEPPNTPGLEDTLKSSAE